MTQKPYKVYRCSVMFELLFIKMLYTFYCDEDTFRE